MTGTVMHARMAPKKNVFKYGIYYIAVPLSKLSACSIARERWACSSFYNKDHGPCDGSALAPWARDILQRYGVAAADGEIVLVCMPRILGYVFNPVSFWLCHDLQGRVRAVICEVHNTFGERHAYLCLREDHAPITPENRLVAQKIFHVSPFLPREGYYEFRFAVDDKEFGVWIDYFGEGGDKMLATSLTGAFSPLNPASLRAAFWRYPLVTLKAVLLIHWQALRIIARGIKYIPKPPQKAETLSVTENIK